MFMRWVGWLFGVTTHPLKSRSHELPIEILRISGDTRKNPSPGLKYLTTIASSSAPPLRGHTGTPKLRAAFSGLASWRSSAGKRDAQMKLLSADKSEVHQPVKNEAERVRSFAGKRTSNNQNCWRTNHEAVKPRSRQSSEESMELNGCEK